MGSSVRQRLRRPSLFLATVFAVIAGAEVCAGDAARHYSPAAGERIPTRVLFGDLHLHSRASADAFSMGNTTLTADEAYRFASGAEVHSSNDMPVRLRRPLDFLAVTDHAEFMGVLNAFSENNETLLDSPLGQRWSSLSAEGFIAAFVEALTNPDPVRDDVPEALEYDIWGELVDSAERHNVPGAFTTFAAYEWTAARDGNNLHRCVIYRDGPERTKSMLPYSSFTSTDPEDLWAALGRYEQETGGRVMAIPHNGNLSNGIMWDTHTLAGAAIDEDYARRRMYWEPVVESTQVKGDSETHAFLSPEDPFATFERWDRYNIMNTARTTPEMLPGSYIRSALKRGIGMQAAAGFNPYQFGQLGSTDSHTGLSTAAEDNFFGKFANSEPGVRRPDSMMAGMKNADWELVASGLAAVWAEENTRPAIFDALQRKEVYATTGSRILLRFFGGWNFGDNAIARPDYARQAYRAGVPMGGELGAAPEKTAPVFLLHALKDPDGANLERLQLIKGWVDSAGDLHEKVYDVALAPDAGASSVDLKAASFDNTVGVSELKAQWRDPDFDSAETAFYYARVIEIPRPRWTEYDRLQYGTPVASNAPSTLQDRAYSSPVWYTPR